MTALLQSVGVAISRREIQRRLTENRDVLRAGLQTSPWISVDDTGARHNAKNGFRTPIGNRPFTWFGPRSSKSRLNVLDLPRAGHTDPAQRPHSATAGARPLPRPAGLKQAHAQGFAPVTQRQAIQPHATTHCRSANPRQRIVLQFLDQPFTP